VQISLVSGGDVPCRATSTGPGFSQQLALDSVCGMVAGDVGAATACVDALFT
jgi:hypothetical protein